MGLIKVQKVINVPITTVAGAYSAGQQVGAAFTIAKANESSGESTLLKSLSLVDSAKQKAALTLLVFSKAPTYANAGDQSALDVSFAEAAAKFVGKVEIATTAYRDLANISVATVSLIDLLLKSEDKPQGSNTGCDLYGVLCTSGTPTYGAGNKLQLRLGVQS